MIAKKLLRLTSTLALLLAPLCANAGIFSTNYNSGTNSYTGGVINYTVDATGFTVGNGDFFTLYDAGLTPMNLTGLIANTALFSITTSLTNSPAPGVILAFADNPTISNIRITYIGTGTVTGNLGSFSLSDPSGGYRIVSVDDRHNNNTISDGSAEGAPILPVASAPEGGSSALLLGLATAGLFAAPRALRRRASITA